MNWALSFWRSTLGKKVVMAVTGLIGIGFVIGHVLGNLLVFRGPTAIDEYAVTLRELGGALWVARLVLIGAVILHVVAAVQLTRRKQAARPKGYAKHTKQVSSWGSRTIRWGGALLFVWLVYHILHFTLGTVHPDFIHLAPYHNLTVAFQNPLVAGFYVLAMIALGLHLYHGAWSSMRTLGVNKPSAHPLQRVLPTVLAVAIAGGFALVPVAIYLGFLS